MHSDKDILKMRTTKLLKMEQRNKETKKERRHEKRKRNVILLKNDWEKEKWKMDE